MKRSTFAERHPFAFSLLLLLLLLVVQGAGVAIAQSRGLPATTFGAYTGLLLALLLAVIVTRLGWWREIGFRSAESPAALLLYLPAFILPLGSLTFGIALSALPALLNFALLAAASGFVEEDTFRGLVLRAFLPRGPWRAVLISAALFGAVHALNVLAGYEPLYALVQIAYALAIGFGFGAMVVKGRLLWPLIVAHALGNFFAFINDGEVGPQLFIVSLTYVLLFTGYGLYLMLRKERVPDTPSAASVS
jgi:hypothetical protein